jgi:eukaryotic-like serine/threonine-protein kinase
VGELFAGRYELVDVLDAGGVGTVWRAWDHRAGDYRAAKVLRQSDGDSLLRFVRETSHRVDHPHVVMPLGWAGEDDRVLFTMPLVRGGSVATLVGDFGALPATWVTVLLRQLLLALEAVHAAGLVHRDVKPANLLLRATGTELPHLLLSDFGAAAAVDAPRLTRSDSVIGTPGYLAPEQVRGADPHPLQDVYAAGVVALELLTGRSPGPGGDLPAYSPASTPRRELAALLAEMTAAEPADRPQGADAARARLDALDRDAAEGASWVPRGQVEVFDHVPPLPHGWGEHGPGAESPTDHPAPPQPSRAGTVTAVLPRRDPRPDPRPSSPGPSPSSPGPSPSSPGPRAGGPGVPAAAIVLAAVGVLLLVLAVLMEI